MFLAAIVAAKLIDGFALWEMQAAVATANHGFKLSAGWFGRRRCYELAHQLVANPGK
jgi:hypothetical protein